MDRAEKALELRRKGYNCAQSVVCAFSDTVDVEEEVLFKIAEGFGTGMGGMQHTCGAVIGAVMLNGLLNSSGKANSGSLGKTLGVSRQLTQAFQERSGSTVCKELKGTETGKMLCSCNDCIVEATKLIEEMLI